MRLLHLHGNSLVSLRGLDHVCRELTELNVSSNDLQSLEGLQDLGCLKRLDVSCNCLRSLEGIQSLRKLQDWS